MKLVEVKHTKMRLRRTGIQAFWTDRRGAMLEGGKTAGVADIGFISGLAYERTGQVQLGS